MEYEDRPRLTIKRIKEGMDWDTDDQCAHCRRRIGAHTLHETWRCGLITKAEYIKILKEDKGREEAKNPSTPA
jgi:hypothetical protein